MDTSIVALFVQKSGQKDDIISIFKHEGTIFKIVYSPFDSKGKYIFYMPREKVLDYISTMLDTLYNDAFPFNYVQLMTCISPSVMYNTADLADVRKEILDLIAMTLVASPYRVEK